jgi:hypothetical protein
LVSGSRAICHRRILLGLALVALAIGTIESSATAISQSLLVPSRVGRFVWLPDLNEARANWEAFSTSVDNEIGGVSPYSLVSGAARDSAGAKNNPEFPQGGPTCGSAYGESLVLGYEVETSFGWVEQLSNLLGCRVANYAVNGNSTDQSYLRFIRRTDRTSFVLLGVDPSSIIDNVSQYGGLLRPPLTPYALKGRFLLESSNSLTWLNRPRVDENGFLALHHSPKDIVPHDYFLPDTIDGPATPRFPFGMTLLRIAFLPRVRAILAGRAEWSDYFADNHPSGASPLLATICEAFVQHARRQGERVLIIVLPVAKSFHERTLFGEFEYTPLITRLRYSGLEVFDAGIALLDLLGGRSYCELFIRSDTCEGHYSVFGNTLLARLVGEELRRRSFVIK